MKGHAIRLESKQDLDTFSYEVKRGEIWRDIFMLQKHLADLEMIR
jgi:hypothetical protein